MMPKSKSKAYSVDGNSYTVSVGECGHDSGGGVRMSVTLKAEYGTGSYCVVEGMVNREYWHDYPDFDPARTISITPRVVCEIIRYAHNAGWSPTDVKSNCRIHLDKEALGKLMCTDS